METTISPGYTNSAPSSPVQQSSSKIWCIQKNANLDSFKGMIARLLQPCLTLCDQGPLSKGFYRQEYWSGLPFPLPGDEPGSPESPALQVESLPTEPARNPFKGIWHIKMLNDYF